MLRRISDELFMMNKRYSQRRREEGRGQGGGKVIMNDRRFQVSCKNKIKTTIQQRRKRETEKRTYKCLTKVERSIASPLGVYFAVKGFTPTASKALAYCNCVT